MIQLDAPRWTVYGALGLSLACGPADPSGEGGSGAEEETGDVDDEDEDEPNESTGESAADSAEDDAAEGQEGTEAPNNVGEGTDDAGSSSGSTSMGEVSGSAATQSGEDTSDPNGCNFEIDASISEAIPTVGIVTWTVSQGGTSLTPEEASIEFGLDTSYGLTAPVDLQEPGFRTLLLGMKADREYHVRVRASVAGSSCESPDFTLTTGPAPNVLLRPTVDVANPAAVAGGYMITGFWGQLDGPSFILDADNDFVWWYPSPDDVMRTRMTIDGKAMWVRNTAQTDGTGLVRRISLDGLTEEVYEVPHSTHDLTILPDGTLGLILHTEGCDEIAIFDPATESLTTVFNGEDAHGQRNCHVNAINYYEPDDAFIFSEWQHSAYVKVRRNGELVWVLNGEFGDFTGTSWTHQHNMHILASNHVLVFSNGNGQENSMVFEYMLDEQAMVATELWRYDGGLQASFGGDVQRLHNGNTLVTYSSAGVIQEVDASGALVQELSWPAGNTVAYVEHRPSLYEGPPPKLYPYEP